MLVLIIILLLLFQFIIVEIKKSNDSSFLKRHKRSLIIAGILFLPPLTTNLFLDSFEELSTRDKLIETEKDAKKDNDYYSHLKLLEFNNLVSNADFPELKSYVDEYKRHGINDCYFLHFDVLTFDTINSQLINAYIATD